MDLESSFPSPLSPQEEAQTEDDYQLEVEVVSTGGGNNNIPSGGMSEHAYSTASKLNPSRNLAFLIIRNAYYFQNCVSQRKLLDKESCFFFYSEKSQRVL